MYKNSLFDLNIDLTGPDYDELDKSLELKLIELYQDIKDLSIKNEVVTRNLRLVLKVINDEFKNHIVIKGMDINILFNAGTMGLMRAIEVMDISKVSKASTYFYNSIKCYILNEINRDNCYLSGLFNLNREYITIRNIRRKNPNIEESDILKHLQLTKERFDYIMKYCNPEGNGRIYLDAKLDNDEDHESRKSSLVDLLSINKSNEYATIYDSDLVHTINIIMHDDRIFNHTERGNNKKKMLYLRYFENKTYKQISKVFGISHQAVQQNVEGTLKKIKKYYGNELYSYL